MQYIAVSEVFKAVAPEYQHWIVSPAEWYLDFDWMLRVFGLLLTCVSSFQDCHVNLWFLDILQWSLYQESRLSSLYLCSLFFLQVSFICPVKGYF